MWGECRYGVNVDVGYGAKVEVGRRWGKVGEGRR